MPLTLLAASDAAAGNVEVAKMFQDAAGVSLIIPRKTSIGLQAAVLFQHHKNWSFDNLGVYQPEFIDLLEMAADSVTQSLRFQGGASPFDPAPALTEILALNALQQHLLQTGQHFNESELTATGKQIQLSMKVLTDRNLKCEPRMGDNKFRLIDPFHASIHLPTHVNCTL